MPTLLEIFPDPEDLLALKPEELAGILIEIASGIVMFETLKAQVFPQGGRGYPAGWISEEVPLALAEALSWLETQGIIVRDPTQSTVYRWTRQGRALKTRTDLEAFRKGRTLPLYATAAIPDRQGSSLVSSRRSRHGGLPSIQRGRSRSPQGRELS